MNTATKKLENVVKILENYLVQTKKYNGNYIQKCSDYD